MADKLPFRLKIHRKGGRKPTCFSRGCLTELSLFAAPAALTLKRRRRELAGFDAALAAMPAGDWRRAWMTVLIDDARRTLDELEQQERREAA